MSHPTSRNKNWNKNEVLDGIHVILFHSNLHNPSSETCYGFIPFIPIQVVYKSLVYILYPVLPLEKSS